MRYGFLILAMLWVSIPASAKVFHSKQSAFAEAFPKGTTIEQKNLYLDAKDLAFIRAQSGVPWQKRLANVYLATLNDQVVAYGYFDTHRVRTLDETILVIVRPDGHLDRVLQIAFHEPAEYRAPARWLDQFVGRELDAKLSMRGDIDGLSGATLTARSLTAHIRATLALHQRKISSTLSAN